MTRIHLNLDEAMLRRLDDVAGPRGRSAYVRKALAEKLVRNWRWEQIMSAWGSIPEDGTHPWDGMDAGEWVASERRRGSKKWHPAL
jgi:predicted transcriptional regulator